ncbi:hypothetical protein ACLB2K_052793 [Fragaria x ananassa]
MFRQVEMKAIRARLDELLSAPYDPDFNLEKQSLNKKFQELLTQEETIWSQQSRALWLKAGDRNTTYFQRRASNRRQRNTIKGLHNADGAAICCHTISEKVTMDMNQELLAPYSDEEVRQALFQMHPSKAPGPDGMSPFFFQKYWKVVGPDVCTAVRSFLYSGVLPEVINFTHVTLIPKVKDPKDMTDLNPIALCNVLYRICSKVLANRLKKILDSVISPLQSAFVPIRLISDNTVATEVAHFLHSNRRVDEHFSLKLDISKVYDRLEWSFVRNILVKLGFAMEWVELIMTTVTTVSYSFLVNGEVRGNVKPSRGIRQGDPLSPYIFILSAEGLSSAIQHFVTHQWIQGINITPDAPTLHHLLFADDSFLFGVATKEECQQYSNILHTYEIASGQRINLLKSSVAFSRHMDTGKQLHLAITSWVFSE